MAINTQNVYLLYDNSSSGTAQWKILCPIKDFPDFGSSISQLETTSLSNTSQTYINGIHQIDALEFTCNYDKTDFQSIKTMETANSVKHFALCFKTSTTGSVTSYGADGVFLIDGYIAIGVAGAGVDEVVEMKITLTPTNDITFSATALTLSE